MERNISSFTVQIKEQKYSVTKLREAISAGTRYNYVFFWKTDKYELSTGCFSQWQQSYFTVNGHSYICAEQYMMGQKALLFNDQETFDRILFATHPQKIKALGRQVRNFDAAIWDNVKYSIVLNGNFYKFSQNREMWEILKSTGDKIIVEASPLDTIWGIGMSEEDVNVSNPHCWKGENLLGFALMEVREQLTEELRTKS
jgi:ribA/ribD-fused uncharacterized protein